MLKTVKMTLRPPNHCSHYYWNRLRDSQLCVGIENEGNSCKGDSGSPIMCKDYKTNRYYMVGITAFGLFCGLGEANGYTR